MIQDIIESMDQRYRRMRRLAIAGWITCALLAAGVVAYWQFHELPNRKALAEARERLEVSNRALVKTTEELRIEEDIFNTFVADLTIIDLEGRVEKNDGEIVAVDLSNTKASDADIKKLEELPRLKKLDLKGTRVTDDAVKRMKEKRPDVKIIR